MASRILFVATAAALAGAIEYDPTQGLTFMYASAAAYCDPSQISSWNCAACTASGAPSLSGITVMTNASTDDQGFVAQDGSGNVWVSFRGTSNIENWINNLKFDKTPFAGCSGCETHLGFTEDYISLSDQMMSALGSLNAASAPAIYLTGHSLGGAMANYAAFELALAGYPVDTMINFGQPRVGNDAYTAGFTSYVIAGSDTGSQTDDTTTTGGHTTGSGGGGGGGTTTAANTTTGTNPPPTTNTNPPTTGGGATTNTHGGTGTGTHTGTTTNNSTATTAGVQAEVTTPAGRHSAFLSSMVSSDLRLNVAALADTNATRVLISPVLALAIEQALAHPLNAHLGIRAEDKEAISATLKAHTSISVAHARKSHISSPLRAPFSPRQLSILAKLRFPAFARAGRSAGNSRLEASIGSALLRGVRRNRTSQQQPEDKMTSTGTATSGVSSGSFSAAAAFRVVHYQDIVPHVPPEAFGYEHSIEEIWYVEDSSTYTRCSTTTGEDAKCSDSMTDLSIEDHLHYLAQPISNLC